MSSGEGEETVMKLLPHLHRGRASPVRQQFREGVVPLAGSDWQSPKQAGTQEVSVEVVFGHNDQVFEMIVVDGNRLVTVSQFRIRIWTFPPLECLHQIDPNYDDDPRTRLPQGTIAARPRQKQAKHFFTAAAAGTGILLVGSADGSVRIYDPKSGKRRFLMEPFVDPKNGFERAYKDSDPKLMAVRCASVLASKNIGVTGCERSEIRIWDCEWGDLLWLLRGHAGTVQMLVIREDMMMLSASDGESVVRVWNLNDVAPLESDKSKGTLIGNTKPVVRAAFYDDVWVTGGSDFSVRLYDPVTYIEKKTLLGHVKSITQIQRRDERSLVTSGADGYIRVWELKTGRQVVTLSGHHFHIVGFYLDGKYAVSGSLDGSLRVWDILTSRTLSVINVGSSSEPMFALTRVSKTRFIGSFPSGIMKMWDISSVLASDQHDNYPVIRQCVGPGGFAFSPSKRMKDPSTVEKSGMIGARESLSRNAPSRTTSSPANPSGLLSSNRKVVKTREGDILLQVCNNAKCRRREERPFQFERCSQCQAAFYCGPMCQEEDWFVGHHWRRCKAPKSQPLGHSIDKIARSPSKSEHSILPRNLSSRSDYGKVLADLENPKITLRSESPKIKLLVKNPNPVLVDAPNFSLGFEASPTDGRRPFNEQLRKLNSSSRNH